MKNASIMNPGLMNEFEMILVDKYMQEKHPDTRYTMTAGNQCIWVYYRSINLYFVFKDGQIFDVQID